MQNAEVKWKNNGYKMFSMVTFNIGHNHIEAVSHKSTVDSDD